MNWEKIFDEIIIEENSMQSVSNSFIDIYDEIFYEFSWVNAVRFIVEKLLSFEFAWLLTIVMMSILFCECTIQIKINFVLLFDKIMLSVMFDCEWIAENCKIFSISRSFLKSRRICVWRTSMILRFMLSFFSKFDFFNKFLKEHLN